jgi:hypothetical protein
MRGGKRAADNANNNTGIASLAAETALALRFMAASTSQLDV